MVWLCEINHYVCKDNIQHRVGLKRVFDYLTNVTGFWKTYYIYTQEARDKQNNYKYFTRLKRDFG